MPPIIARPTFVLLHALGGSARSWDPVLPYLKVEGTCLALDLPGFGDLEGMGASDISATLTHLLDQVRGIDGPWIVVGHSMGGKFATLMAAARPEGLAGVMLIAGSPPSPEPIDDERRRDMLGWVSDGPMSEDHAREFVAANTAATLAPDPMAQAVADLCRTLPAAWVSWLTDGVAEDRSAEVPELLCPALILAGAADGDLGLDAQRNLNLPLYANGILRVIDDAAHLMPQEQPAMVAAGIIALWHKIGVSESATLDPVTRPRLLDRLDGPAPEDEGILDAASLRLLQAVVDRIVPQDEVRDIARRIDVALATGQGDGWRFADLPADAEAYRIALTALTAAAPDFAKRSAPDRDALLTDIAEGRLSTPSFSARQFQMWFEDVRAQAVREWVAHPVTVTRIGYDGLADPRLLPEGAMRA